MAAILPIIYSYLPSINSMKLPEIPGRIIAQIAIAPLRNINQSESGVVVGERVQITTPKTIPTHKDM